MTDEDGWREVKLLVMTKLDEHGQELRETRREMGNLTGEVKALKVKSGVWGAVAGAIPAAIGIIWVLTK